ncbi:MAG: RNA polymerase sigma factor [Flavobacteriales bacterium]|jgi:RNA polymerase sigma-70 factor (ECF subfamily)|nr:RNA polymerase sigma factor [Flavobacteriales bacterium]
MDKTIFNQIYKDYNGMVYNLCLSYLQNIEEAEEVMQDVFLKVYEKHDSFRGNSSLKTWIYRITINKNLDFIKAKKRVKRLGFLAVINGDSKNQERPLVNFNHPGVELEDKEAIQLLFQKINTLPPKQKTALILKYIDGFSQKEIALTMALSEKAVESLLSRAKRKLKSKLR